MPRFFFHLRSPQKNLVDCEGMMLRHLEEARGEATKAVQDFFQPATGRVQAEWEDWRIEVSDQRGRCVYAMAFADAAAPTRDPIESPLEQGPPVIYLDIARARREFSSLEQQMRSLVRRASELVACTHSEARTLKELASQTEELRQASQELLDRSRRQSALGFMHVSEQSAWGGPELQS
jgi:hypothetical protein